MPPRQREEIVPLVQENGDLAGDNSLVEEALVAIQVEAEVIRLAGITRVDAVIGMREVEMIAGEVEVLIVPVPLVPTSPLPD